MRLDVNGVFAMYKRLPGPCPVQNPYISNDCVPR